MVRFSLISLVSTLLLLDQSVAYGSFTPNVGGGASLRRRQYGPMGHGAYGMFGGVEYRWHQIYDGTWVGVDPTEWDDAVHTQNDVLPPWSGYSIDAAGGNSTLEERDLVANICSAGNACLAVTQNAAYNIRTAASQFFTNLAQTQPKEAVLNFLSKPVVQRIVVSGGINGAISGFVGGQVQKAVSPNGPGTLTNGVTETSVCSAQKDALDAVILLLQQQAKQFAQLNAAINSLSQELKAINITIGSAVNSQAFISVAVATIQCGETVSSNPTATCGIALNSC